MMLQTLAEYRTVKEAAAAEAGNWKRWDCFVWFGADDVPNSDDVALGYLVNNCDPTLRQLTNLEYVRAQLSRWWGDLTAGALVGDFGSSVWGDAGALSGLSVRVYGPGRIVAKPFGKLHAIARRLRDTDDGIVDRETFDRVQRREMLSYVHGQLGYECRERGHPFDLGLVESVVDSLIDNEVDYDNDDLNEAINDEMGWEVTA